MRELTEVSPYEFTPMHPYISRASHWSEPLRIHVRTPALWRARTALLLGGLTEVSPYEFTSMHPYVSRAGSRQSAG